MKLGSQLVSLTLSSVFLFACGPITIVLPSANSDAGSPGKPPPTLDGGTPSWIDAGYYWYPDGGGAGGDGGTPSWLDGGFYWYPDGGGGGGSDGGPACTESTSCFTDSDCSVGTTCIVPPPPECVNDPVSPCMVMPPCFENCVCDAVTGQAVCDNVCKSGYCGLPSTDGGPIDAG